MARPLSFDPETARKALMHLFWDKGFDGASMQDVEDATGLKKQSLYRMFGDKRHMYLAALDCYRECEMMAAEALVAGPGPARARIGRMVTEMVEHAIKTGDRRGCFLCNASVDQAPHDLETDQMVKAMVGYLKELLETALLADARYRDDQDLCARRTAHLVAGYFGLRVLIKSGQSPDMLRAAAADLLASV
ncbi:MAG: TetR/AcrR family transcriptional regulator [Albidovulum sp.]